MVSSGLDDLVRNAEDGIKEQHKAPQRKLRGSEPMLRGLQIPDPVALDDRRLQMTDLARSRQKWLQCLEKGFIAIKQTSDLVVEVVLKSRGMENESGDGMLPVDAGLEHVVQKRISGPRFLR